MHVPLTGSLAHCGCDTVGGGGVGLCGGCVGLCGVVWGGRRAAVLDELGRTASECDAV